MRAFVRSVCALSVHQELHSCGYKGGERGREGDRLPFVLSPEAWPRRLGGGGVASRA